ncbi:MAG: hypothetical protein QOH26_1703 [Actinomycetota bacterium]|nr:hypothetical protein [Actinomycetota bacterium]
MRCSARTLLSLALLLGSASCAGTGEELTASGKGFPKPSIEFPATSPSGSVQTAVLTIENPGPGDIDSLFVTFVLASPLAGEDLPAPIANGGPGGKDPNVISISPKPVAVDATGVNYRFEALAEGETTTITFELRVPDQPGPAANSVLVSDGAEIERARGVRLQTEVER